MYTCMYTCQCISEGRCRQTADCGYLWSKKWKGERQEEFHVLFSMLLWFESWECSPWVIKEKSLELNPEEHSKANPKNTEVSLSSVEKPESFLGKCLPSLVAVNSFKSGLEALKQMRHYSGEIITRVVLKLLHSLSEGAQVFRMPQNHNHPIYLCRTICFSQGLLPNKLHCLNGKDSARREGLQVGLQISKYEEAHYH